MPELPMMIYEALKNSAGNGGQEKQLHEMKKIRDEMKRGNQRNVIAIGGASLLMSAFIVFGLDGYVPSMLMGAPLISWVLVGIGAFFLLFAFQD